MKPVLGIILEFGYHESKKYIHSGFARKAAEKFNLVWFYINKDNQYFNSLFEGTGSPLIEIDIRTLRRNPSDIEVKNNAVRRAWMVSKNLGSFHNYRVVNRRTLKTILLGTNRLKNFYEKRALKEIATLYVSPYLLQLFKENGIQHVLSTGYSSALSKAVFVTAKSGGIKTWYLVNSWKDLYVNNFVPFDFLNGIFVWSKDMEVNYKKHMPYLRNTDFIVSGNPTFDALLQHECIKSKSDYASKYGLNKSAKWVIYTLMPPGINNNEIETIKLVARVLRNKYSTDEVVILLRLNPNHNKNHFKDLEMPDNVVFMEHYCTYDKQKDLIIQSKEGEYEWLDMLHYSDLNFSVPSTVTLEFLALNKPILNIGFGPDGRLFEPLLQHFEAGFYKKLFTENPLVKKVLKIDDILVTFEEVAGLVVETEKHSVKTKLANDKIISHIS